MTLFNRKWALVANKGPVLAKLVTWDNFELQTKKKSRLVLMSMSFVALLANHEGSADRCDDS